MAVGLASEQVEDMREGFVEIGHIRGEQSTEKEIEKHRWDRQQQSTACGDEGLSDSLS
jgi:hypothetical protein